MFENTSNGNLLKQSPQSCVYNLQTGPCLFNHMCKSGTHFGREHACAISHKFMFKTLVKMQFCQFGNTNCTLDFRALLQQSLPCFSATTHEDNGLSPPETKSMAGRVCGREKGTFFATIMTAPLASTYSNARPMRKDKTSTRGGATGRACRRTPGQHHVAPRICFPLLAFKMCPASNA